MRETKPNKNLSESFLNRDFKSANSLRGHRDTNLTFNNSTELACAVLCREQYGIGHRVAFRARDV